jgi:uncharacterized protein (TIGR00251 family)
MENMVKIQVKVVPNASKNEIIGVILDEFERKILHIRIKAVPEKGKANKELIKFLSKEWKIPTSDIELARGETGRYKTIVVRGGCHPEFISGSSD